MSRTSPDRGAYAEHLEAAATDAPRARPGGAILIERNEKGVLIDAECITREGWRLSDCDLAVFKGLKQKRLTASPNRGPDRITRDGLARLRAQADNRTSARAW